MHEGTTQPFCFVSISQYYTKHCKGMHTSGPYPPGPHPGPHPHATKPLITHLLEEHLDSPDGQVVVLEVRRGAAHKHPGVCHFRLCMATATMALLWWLRVWL